MHEPYEYSLESKFKTENLELELFYCVHICWCWMDKTAIQNETETKELMADDARACGCGSWGVTTAYLHFISGTNWYFSPSSF